MSGPAPDSKRSFVGRADELALGAAFLGAASGTSTLLVHGPGGIGKSAFLDELADIGPSLGYQVHRWMGMELASATVELDAVGDIAAWTDDRRLLIIDGCDDFEALWLQLRVRVAKRTALGNRVVIASRQAPEKVWHRLGWDDRAASLMLEPLAPADADALALERGVTATTDRAALVAWGAGLPLALSLAADVVRERGRSAASLASDPDLATMLQAHVVGANLTAASHLALAVAAIAAEVDVRVLAAAAPTIDPVRAEVWLRSLSFVSPVGSRLRIHDSVRQVVQAALAASAPDQDVEIRRNLADFHVRRGMAGDPAAIVDMSRLVRDPLLRYGLGSGMGRRVQVTIARSADVDEVLGATGFGPRRTAHLQRWFRDAPEHIVITRDDRGRLAGWGLAATLRTHPEWIGEDPVLGTWFQAARSAHPDDDAFLVREIVDFGGADDEVSPILAAGYAWFVQRLGQHNPRFSYVCTRYAPGDDSTAEAWLTAMGYRVRPELTIVDGEDARFCYSADHGDGGMAGDTWRLLYRDIGLPPGALLPADDAVGRVRDALRSIHDSVQLARNPLARGGSPLERADTLRTRLLAAVDVALAQRPEDDLLLQVIEQAYLQPGASPQRAIRGLPIGRSTYYRRLDEALARIAQFLG